MRNGLAITHEHKVRKKGVLNAHVYSSWTMYCQVTSLLITNHMIHITVVTQPDCFDGKSSVKS